LASDGKGQLYVADGNTIRKVGIATGEVTTIAGDPEKSGSMDGVGKGARFGAAHGLVHDGAGQLFITDNGNRTLRRLDLASGQVNTFAGAVGGEPAMDGIGTSARFGKITDISRDDQGHLFVSDDYAVRMIDVATAKVTTLAGSLSAKGTNDGMGADARFYLPAGQAVDGQGGLFVADSGNHTIRRIDLASATVTTWVGNPLRQGSADGTGIAARFNAPTGVASNGNGLLFMLDTENHTIRQVDPATGQVTTLAGTPGKTGSADGIGGAALFHSPEGITADDRGNLFVADTVNHTIRQVVIATGQVTTLAGQPMIFGKADLVGKDARFQNPTGLVCDQAGHLFIADRYNESIRQVDITTGAVTTLAGSGEIGGKNGVGREATFYHPVAITFDRAGHLFVTEYYGETIRQIEIATGAVTTLAGSYNNLGKTDGIGDSARFYYPVGITYDGNGHLFVADAMNYAIRKVVIQTGEVTTLVGALAYSNVVLGPLTTARLASPRGLTFLAPGQLFLVDNHENVLLRAQF
jgi:streptogramin lyase